LSRVASKRQLPRISSFHPVLVVAPNTLPNYEDEVLKLTAGCAVQATGMIVPSPAKGQPFEMQASAVRVIGWVDDPDTYPIQPKPHTLQYLREDIAISCARRYCRHLIRLPPLPLLPGISKTLALRAGAQCHGNKAGVPRANRQRGASHQADVTRASNPMPDPRSE
jgi:hypothetical protein